MGCVIAAVSSIHGFAAERYRPSDPQQIVLVLPAQAVRDPLARSAKLQPALLRDPAAIAVLAQQYLRHAREHREPRWFGRAEALLRPWSAKPDVPAPLLRMHADVLQHRHDFAGALRLLDRALAAAPADLSARLMRASVLMVSGRYANARPDCMALLAAGALDLGTPCLAQVLGGTGSLQKAELLLDTVLQSGRNADPAVRSWMLALGADFADRRGDLALAERYLREALAATPADEAIRTALADVFLARGAAREALPILAIPRPSAGLLVRRARAQKTLRDPGLRSTLGQIEALLRVGSLRGERVHLREEAMLALDVQHVADRALELARANFDQQRETLDVRLLARTARAAGDRATLEELAAWQEQTGFQDCALDAIFHGTER